MTDESEQQWPQVVFDLQPAQVDAVEEALFAAGALSVLYQDQGDQPVLEPEPGEMRLWDKVRLTGLFSLDSRIEPVETTLGQILGSMLGQMPPHRWEALPDRQWERVWMDDYQPMQFGQRLWICPTHCDLPADIRCTSPDSGPLVIRLDPGLAFGTGTHSTTRLCLEWIDSSDLSGKTVIDYGCGSGVLAVAAALAGARGVEAVDIDEQALVATRSNAELNRVADRIQARKPVPLQSDAEPTAVDVLLANILFEPLTALAPAFARYVRPQGELVLSGLLNIQAEAIRLRYNQWFKFISESRHQDWIALHAIRK